MDTALHRPQPDQVASGLDLRTPEPSVSAVLELINRPLLGRSGPSAATAAPKSIAQSTNLPQPRQLRPTEHYSDGLPGPSPQTVGDLIYEEWAWQRAFLAELLAAHARGELDVLRFRGGEA